MSILHSQLSIYRAIDELVVSARLGTHGAADRQLLATAAHLLPNSTGFGQAGWSGELEKFLESHRPPDRTDQGNIFPELAEAAAEINAAPPPRLIRTTDSSAVAVQTFSRAEPPDDSPSDDTYDSSYDPVLARASYGAFVLAKLYEIAGRDIGPPEVLGELREVLAVGIDVFTPGAGLDRRTGAADYLLANMAGINSRQDWTGTVTGELTARFGVNPRFANDSKPCFGSLELVDDIYCSTVVTDSYDADVSVSDVEKILDPLNWDLCCKFFHAMTINAPNPNAQGWSRVREKIGAEYPEYFLQTDLIFFKGRRPDGTLFLNYDLDPDPPADTDSWVKVDNGYIHVAPANDTNNRKLPGVRIRTSKKEHVDGLSPCATAALACLMGWGDTGREMLAGTARRVAQGAKLARKLTPFKPSKKK
ncbi:hypothetical protein [Mycobacterium sp. DL592]|uniref:hypothetical protein n=1 Tax=Mycobacterium sp. DL592 TaxID=2675524 RepID=UPI00142344C8|nr:hypothetical protein [Mycobacterium sp. DL592]